MDKFEEGLNSFKEILVVNKKDVSAWHHSAIALYRMDRIEEALEASENACKFEPENMSYQGLREHLKDELESDDESLSSDSSELSPEIVDKLQQILERYSITEGEDEESSSLRELQQAQQFFNVLQYGDSDGEYDDILDYNPVLQHDKDHPLYYQYMDAYS